MHTKLLTQRVTFTNVHQPLFTMVGAPVVVRVPQLEKPLSNLLLWLTTLYICLFFSSFIFNSTRTI